MRKITDLVNEKLKLEGEAYKDAVEREGHMVINFGCELLRATKDALERTNPPSQWSHHGHVSGLVAITNGELRISFNFSKYHDENILWPNQHPGVSGYFNQQRNILPEKIRTGFNKLNEPYLCTEAYVSKDDRGMFIFNIVDRPE